MTPDVDALRAGDTTALARAITLVESRAPRHRAAANRLLADLGSERDDTLRLGLTGPPGAGKSTLIEHFGTWLCDQGMKVAVLAIDPSSTRTAGSILGDKTRMAQLSQHPRAYVRPSPSRGALGGVARATREAILLCEAAGFDVVIVETVGVGQSEVMVADMTDCFCVLLPPGGGDDLQGIKKGMIEQADLLAVTKADGDLTDAARRAVRDLRAALHILGPRENNWSVPVVALSALEQQGFDELWSAIGQHRAWGKRSGARRARRQAQRLTAFDRLLREELVERVMREASFQPLLDAQRARLEEGSVAPGVAADNIVDALLSAMRKGDA